MAAKETPATRAGARAGVTFVVHEYEHDPGTKSYALEAAAALGVDPARVFKTLVVTVRDGFADCIVPSDATLAPDDLISPTDATVQTLRRDAGADRATR